MRLRLIIPKSPGYTYLSIAKDKTLDMIIARASRDHHMMSLKASCPNRVRA